MGLSLLSLPKAVPLQRMREAQASIPPTLAEREALRAQLRSFVAEKNPVLPLSFAELRSLADEFLQRHAVSPRFRDYVAVLLSNEAWRESLAAVPYERRLLLLPKCLRVEHRCPAPFDEFGLLCKQCGLCTIQELQEEAERLGYAVLVAEGSALVMALIKTGKIDAVVGVSCLSVLERAFPYMESAAIPGVAIPLLQDDCADTNVDLEWVWDAIHLTSHDRSRRLDLDTLRTEVTAWFQSEGLAQVLGPEQGETDRLARAWLARGGKRWRPMLATCAYQALQEDPHGPRPLDLHRIAFAVECFHKASLVHDDIEDNDPIRSGEPTLHEQHGVPVALNAGDLLLGEGYRLLAECDASPAIRAELLRIAAAGHRTLCLGQGAELAWTRDPRPLSTQAVLEIFRQKTAPAFEVALRLGCVLGGADPADMAVLTRYSEALGIAYQIRDDLEDLTTGDLEHLRPSLPLALALERAVGDDRTLLERAWQRQADAKELAAILERLGVPDRCRRLFESYKEEAIRALGDLKNPSLKGLLRRLIGKIFEPEIQGWCSEFEARNAAGRPAGAEAAG